MLATPLLRWYRIAEPDKTQLVNNNNAAGLWYLEITDFQHELGNDVELGNVYYPRDLSGNLTEAPLPLDFEGNLTFIAVEQLELPAQGFFQPADVLQLTTYWQVDDILAEDIGVFVRLHDIPQASPYTEINKFDVDTTRLHAGDYVVQVGFLTLPLQLRSHEYLFDSRCL